MPDSLLDECYQSILKIAGTQSHDGKRAILALAERFQDSSGGKSYDSQPSLSQNIRAPDRQRIPSDRLRSRSPSRQAACPGLPASVTRDRICQLRITRDQTLRSCTARMIFPTT